MPSTARADGYRHRGKGPIESTKRQAGLPVRRKFSKAMWQRWLADHNKIQAERLIGPL